MSLLKIVNVIRIQLKMLRYSKTCYQDPKVCPLKQDLVRKINCIIANNDFPIYVVIIGLSSTAAKRSLVALLFVYLKYYLSCSQNLLATKTQ